MLIWASTGAHNEQWYGSGVDIEVEERVCVSCWLGTEEAC